MLRALALLLLLAACATPATLETVDSGLSGRISDQVRISDHPHHVLMGHVLIAARGDEITRALVIQQRRDGVHSLRIRQAWQEKHHGKQSDADEQPDAPTQVGRPLDRCNGDAVAGLSRFGLRRLRHRPRPG